MTNSSLIKDMLDNSVHIWYKSQYWSPKMKSYLYWSQNWIHVFDLYKTVEKLDKISQTLKDFMEKGKEILIVWSKVQAQEITKQFAIETWNFYTINKWVPGLFTNFATLKKRIFTYNKLEKDLESWAFSILNKKEKSEKIKEIEKLKKSYEWVKELKKVPDVIFVIDWHYESLALLEAKKMKIPSYTLLWSNWDIDSCTDFIPCNVNSTKSIKFILDYVKPFLLKKKVNKNFDSIKEEFKEEHKTI